MKNYVFIVFLLLPFGGFSQSCDCQEALDFTISILKKAPSYKDQIKGDRVKAFQTEIQDIRSEIDADPSIGINCLSYLAKAMKLVEDEHLYAIPEKGRTIPEKTDSLAIQAFMNQDRIQIAPVFTGDLDALSKKLDQASGESPEGIYFDSRSIISIGVYRKESAYEGVILSSTSSYWKPGQIMFQVKPIDSDRVEGIRYDAFRDARYSVARSTKRILENWNIWKDPKNQSPAFILDRDTQPSMIEFDDQVLYVYLSDFSGQWPNIKRLDSLYAEVQLKLPETKHLILDVRNNGGGGQRAYNAFLDILKDYEKQIKLHLVFNRKTGSAAEHFSVELKEMGAKWYGENTRGAINYRYGNGPKSKNNQFVVPCFNYRIGITVARNPGKYRNVEREVKGLKPDLFLDEQSDWIEQIRTQIEKD